MLRTVSAGGIVLNERGDIALVRHGETDFWGFPKGHVDPGETTVEAARREIGEETGIDNLTLIGELGSYQRYKGMPAGGDDMSELKTIHMFVFTTTQEKLLPRDPGNPEARWVAQENVEETLSNPNDKEFFRGVRSRIATY